MDDQPTGTARTAAGEAARTAVRAVLEGLDLPWSETRPGLFAVTLPGTAKLTTACALEVGRHGLAVRAFVARRPDENHAEVYRWLLQRNLKLRGVCFSLDAAGDIHLTGTVPLDAVTPALVDQVLGTIAETADASFNPILERGFATSIAREWAWRRSRGEPTTNLAAFAHLDPERHPPAPEDPAP
ncbi:Putative sensory transduction regulator [Friedmanniella luteola]|uniref:Putative sensory transduction regulator n=1 Tax=Friedmanniella luteola TaxID=546871 RepID=A0A1H1LY06_9ACTN|nr:YbjN domain-containing protein [Friedmanniella luteola]SDR79260.1 Putative sensory transduction regulator [Friedmanniella luteola]